MAEATVFVMFIFFFALLTSTALYYRHKKVELVHKERMAAMEKGVALPVFPPEEFPSDPARRYLLSGMIWLFSGAALATFLFTLSATMPQHSVVTMQERQAKIEELRKLGAPDFELRRVIYDEGRRDPQIPIGIGTVGLVPMGVGIAYLIFFFVERKKYSVTSE